MDILNNIDRSQAPTREYRPILRPSTTEFRADSQLTECSCPDLCLIDHDN